MESQSDFSFLVNTNTWLLKRLTEVNTSDIAPEIPNFIGYFTHTYVCLHIKTLVLCSLWSIKSKFNWNARQKHSVEKDPQINKDEIRNIMKENQLRMTLVQINCCSAGRVLFYFRRRCLYRLSSQTLLNNQARSGVDH